MQTKATVSTGYLVRLGIMTVASLGLSVYFLYDGYIAYPRADKVYHAWEEYKQKHGEETFAVWSKDIKDPSSSVHGMPASYQGENPGTDRNEGDFLLQKAFGYALLPIGLAMLWYTFTYTRRWTAIGDGALLANGGVKVPFDEIEKLDKTRWREKGIAVVQYRDEDAQITKRLTLDDWKFDRHATTQILETIEENLSDDQIVGGERESVRKAQHAAAEAEARAAMAAKAEDGDDADDQTDTDSSEPAESRTA